MFARWVPRVGVALLLCAMLIPCACQRREPNARPTAISTRVVEQSPTATPTATQAAKPRDSEGPRLSLEALPAQVGPDDGLKVVASAVDNEGVDGMALALDGAVLRSVEGGSLRYNVDTRELASGVHELTVRAWDAQGNESRIEAAFELSAQVPATLPVGKPTVEPTDTARSTTTLPPTVPAPTIAPTVTVARGVPAVSAVWGTCEIATYDYSAALYRDLASVGHPYSLLHRDQVGSARPVSYESLVVANTLIELTFLPELGGRLYQIRYLPTGQTLLYNNATIKPTHWGPEDQGWWLAVGGMEWCLPVNEHGYLTAEPWDCQLERLDDGGVTVWLGAETHNSVMAVIGVTLRPEDARIEIETMLRNVGGEAVSLQYWMNAMLAPTDNRAGPGLRFYYPTERMQVHSTGAKDLAEAGDWIAWPVQDGRELWRFDHWNGLSWLGLFCPELETPFNAVYDESAAIGLVRCYPPETAKGSKLFAFAPDAGLANEYTDDGSSYVEMWGGLPRTFWPEDDVRLDAGASVVWIENWYPVASCPKIVAANARACLGAEVAGDQLELTLFVPHGCDALVRVARGDVTLLAERLLLRGGESRTLSVALNGNGLAGAGVTIQEAGNVLLVWDAP